MRPLKTILLYCADPDKLGILAYVLAVHHYRVIQVADEATAETVMMQQPSEINCLLVVDHYHGPLDCGEALCVAGLLRLRAPVLLWRANEEEMPSVAHFVLPTGATVEELLEVLRRGMGMWRGACRGRLIGGGGWREPDAERRMAALRACVHGMVTQ